MEPMIIDVREQDEFEQGHVDGALNIPLSTLPSAAELSEIPKNYPLVLYCRSGSRSGHAIHLLEQMGYTNLTNGINQERIQQQG